MGTVLIIVVLLLLGGGGVYYGRLDPGHRASALAVPAAAYGNVLMRTFGNALRDVVACRAGGLRQSCDFN